jgi:hypothetical protein
MESSFQQSGESMPVYAYKGDYQPVKEPLLVDIDMAEIALAYSSAATV